MMKKYFSLLVAFTFICLQLTAQTRTERTIGFIKMLEREQFDSCYATFDTVIGNKLSADRIGQVWAALNKNFGEYKGYLNISSTQKDSLEKVSVLCNFAKMKIDLNLVYNKNNKVVGFTFTPPKNTTAYRQPEYSKLGSFYETKVNVKTGKYSLPGILCLPNNISNPPVVILLSGSGPNDRDESIGPNKILKDLALGLAANGIGTLRYDKRSLVYARELTAREIENFGIDEEVVADALSAIRLVQKNPATKKSKIFVAGHSLGGACAPLVASRSKAVQGIVLMAANARPLEDLLLEQVNYLAATDSVDADEKESIKALEKQVKIVKNNDLLKVAKATDLPLGLNAYYWQSLKKYDQLATARKIKQPALVLQGGRDYQVSMRDLQSWQSALIGAEKNKYIIYDDLNHLFMKGMLKSTPAEYMEQGNVDGRIITDISNWIKTN